jgi:hypothetical protein
MNDEMLWAGEWKFKPPYYNPRHHRDLNPFAVVGTWTDSCGEIDQDQWIFVKSYKTKQSAMDAAKGMNRLSRCLHRAVQLIT